MSIELKQAAEQALKELGEARKIVRASSSRQLAKDWDRRATDALANLRTAIQQAQQPATGEPVGYMNEGHIHEFAMRRIPYGYVYPEAGAGASTAVYTHPAPSVPKLIEIAISSGCFNVLPVKATIPMCKAGWGASGGELTFQQIGHIYEEMYKARPIPDDAIYAAPSVPDDVVLKAKRYEWLRQHQLLAKINYMPTPSGEDLDAAIDAAMLAAKDSK